MGALKCSIRRIAEILWGPFWGPLRRVMEIIRGGWHTYHQILYCEMMKTVSNHSGVDQVAYRQGDMCIYMALLAYRLQLLGQLWE